MKNIKERLLVITVAIIGLLIMLSVFETLCKAGEVDLSIKQAPTPENHTYNTKQFIYQISITPSGKVEPNEVLFLLIGSNLTFTNSFKNRILLKFDNVEFVLNNKESVTFNFIKKSQIIYNIQIPEERDVNYYFGGVVVK